MINHRVLRSTYANGRINSLKIECEKLHDPSYNCKRKLRFAVWRCSRWILRASFVLKISTSRFYWPIVLVLSRFSIFIFPSVSARNDLSSDLITLILYQVVRLAVVVSGVIHSVGRFKMRAPMEIIDRGKEDSFQIIHVASLKQY